MAALESLEALPLRLWPFCFGQFAVLGDIGRRMVRIAGVQLVRPEAYFPAAGRKIPRDAFSFSVTESPHD
jgi:hypothetical protein